MAENEDQATVGDIGAAVYNIGGRSAGSNTGGPPVERGAKGGVAGESGASDPNNPNRLDTNQGDLSTGGAGGTNDPGTGTGDTINDHGRDGMDTGTLRG